MVNKHGVYPVSEPTRTRTLAAIRGTSYAVLLLWLNVYLCQELFRNITTPMASMHGFWIALARLGGGSLWHSTWWPYWDCGMPFEFTYAPLVPAITGLWAAIHHVSTMLAFNQVIGAIYCLTPVTLWMMASALTRSPGWSFIAALFYSLYSPTELLLPDRNFTWSNLLTPRRLYLLGVWDDGPHLAALTLIPLIVVLLSLAVTKRKAPCYIATIALIAIAAMTSFFGATVTFIATLCLLSVLPRRRFLTNLGIAAAIGVAAYAIASPFLSPSLMMGIPGASASRGSDRFTIESLTAIALIAVGWILLRKYLPRWTQNWQLQFFALFTYLTGAIPIVALDLHRQFVPQPYRYKLEMELGLALVVTFSLRPWINRMSIPLRVALLFLFLSLCGEQIIHIRHQSKDWFADSDPSTTIESKAAMWATQNLPGKRIMTVTSTAQWLNAFTDIPPLRGRVLDGSSLPDPAARR